jgi:transposase
MLPPRPPAPFVIRQVRLDGDVVWLDAEGVADACPCPACGTVARQVHDRYTRRPLDVPWRATPTRVALTVRRFRCPSPACARRTFAESFGPALARCARRTAAATALLLQVAGALGGEAGARLARRLGLPVSPDTLLRILGHDPLAAGDSVRVLGVDEWAWKRGHRYGTVLVDLERHQIVDLLPERSAASLARWLDGHPGTEVAARDRSGVYAEGLRLGAPDAVQVVDRWHLLKNAGDVLERVLQRHQAALRAAVPTAGAEGTDAEGASTVAPRGRRRGRAAAPPSGSPAGTPSLPGGPRVTPAEARRRAAYDNVLALRRQGRPLAAIARETGLDRKTVRSYLCAGAFPERAAHPRRLEPLSPHAAYLRRRWAEGCHSAAQLWDELKARGFGGSAVTVRRHVAGWRGAPPRGAGPARPPPAARPPRRRASPPPPARRPSGPSPRRVRWWLLQAAGAAPRAKVPTAEERAYCDRLLAGNPAIAAAVGLTVALVRVVQERDAGGLGPWLTATARCGEAELREFAAGLTRDRAAVEAALRLPWSTGPVEGLITKLKYVSSDGLGGVWRVTHGRMAAGGPLLDGGAECCRAAATANGGGRGRAGGRHPVGPVPARRRHTSGASVH